MIENFNGPFNLILFILVIGLQGFYSFRLVFSPSGIVKEFNTGEDSIYLARVLGIFVVPLFLMGLIILFGGPEGTWVYFVLLFMIGLLQMVYETAFHFKLVDKNISAKNSKFDICMCTQHQAYLTVLLYSDTAVIHKVCKV